jgi:hypothetical protein
VNILGTIDDARRAFEVAGRGCLVRLGEDESRYATVAEIAARLEPHPDATMLLTAVSEAVERYDPSREAAILLQVAFPQRHLTSVREAAVWPNRSQGHQPPWQRGHGGLPRG